MMKYKNTESSSIGILKKLSGRKLEKPYAKKVLLDLDFYSLVVKYKTLQKDEDNSTNFKNFFGYKQCLKITKDLTEEEQNLLGNVFSFKLIFEKKSKIFLCKEEETLKFWINSFKTFFVKKENLVEKVKNKIIQGYRNSIVEPDIFKMMVRNALDKIEKNPNRCSLKLSKEKKSLENLFLDYFSEIAFVKMRDNFVKYLYVELKSLKKNIKEFNNANEAIAYKKEMDIEWRNFEEKEKEKEEEEKLQNENNLLYANTLLNNKANEINENFLKNNNHKINKIPDDSNNNNDLKESWNNDNYKIKKNSWGENTQNNVNDNLRNSLKKSSVILEDPDRYIILSNNKNENENENKDIGITLSHNEINGVKKEEKLTKKNKNLAKNLEIELNEEFNKNNKPNKKRIGVESPKFSNILILAQRFNKVDNIDEWKEFIKSK